MAHALVSLTTIATIATLAAGSAGPLVRPSAADVLRQELSQPPGAPPFRLGRLHPAGPLAPRLLALRFTAERYAHPSPTFSPEDPLANRVAGASVSRHHLEIGYGIGYGLTASARFGWLAAERDAEDGAPWDESGAEDARLLMAATTPLLASRIRARVEGGVFVASGSETRLTADSTIALEPWSAGETRGQIGGTVTAALAGGTGDGPVAVHVHAEAVHVGGGGSTPPGIATSPFRERLPLVGVPEIDPDRFDFRLAFSVTHARASLFAEVEWPVLLDAEGVVSGSESPRALSPGCVLRFLGVDVGAQVDLLWFDDDPGTKFDPDAVFPDWVLAIRVGTDFAIRDRDRDRDGVEDLDDRCPEALEDRDGYLDQDGCPDSDNDRDGIPDRGDRCPDAPEDGDGFEDEDGCPEPDNDLDGIPDAYDHCPRTPEDRDGFEDQDGCPEGGGEGP
jgi:Thrombospondin type 3 repeat